MNPDIFDRFLARYEKGPETRTSPLDPDTLKKIQEEVNQVVDPLPLPDLDEAARADMAGKRFPEITDLMFECAAGLREFADIAQEVEASPEIFETAARQDMALGGFIVGLQAVYSAADTGLLLTGAEGSDLCDQAERELKATVGDESLNAAGRRSLGFAFGESLRVRGKVQQAAPTPVAPSAQTREQELQQKQDQEHKKQQVYKLLSDIKEGKVASLGPALAALSPGKKAGK